MKIVEEPQVEQNLLLSVSTELHSTCDELLDSTTEDKVESHAQVKSFDMPSIDDDHDIDQVKQEKENLKSQDSLKTKNSPEKSKCPEVLKKVPTEKFHPGIENVVEKLKKHAAAVFQDNETKTKEIQLPTLTAESELRHEIDSRKLQNGLKKLILRSCENSFEKIGTIDHPGVVRSDHEDTDNLESASHSSKVENNLANVSENNNNNNNKNKNNQNDSKDMMDETLSKEKKEENIIFPSNSSADEELKLKEAEDSKVKEPKIKINVDLSGLELLSNSIEQLEHLKPDTQNGIPEGEQTPTKLKSISQHNENNNNVDSPLGLLCALAEQRFMEEVADSNPKKSIENSEEISQAGRLLLNLGKVSMKNEKLPGEKRKYSSNETGDYEGLKRLKTFASRHEEVAFELRENAKRNINFSEMSDSNLVKKLDSLGSSFINGELTDSDAEIFDDDDDDDDDEENRNDLRICMEKSSEFNHHQYSTFEAKMETKKFIRKKSHPDNEADFPNMDAMELDMRVRMADIQRQYREKQMELSKLTPKKEDKKSFIRARKKSQSSR